MSFKLDPALFLKDLEKLQALSKNMIDSEQIIISFSKDSYSIQQYYTSGAIRAGKPGDTSFLVPTKQLSQILGSMRGDKEVVLTETKDSLEITSEMRNYQVPITWLSEEMQLEMFKPKDKEKQTFSMAPEMIVPMMSLIGAQQKMNSKSSIRTIVTMKKDETNILIGGTTVVGIIECKGENKDLVDIESTDGILMNALTKLQSMSASAKIHIRENTIGLTDTGIELLHSFEIKPPKTTLSSLYAVTAGKEPTTVVTMNASDMLDRIHNTGLIADKMEMILIEFAKEKVEIRVSTGMTRYKSAFKTQDMTLTGEEVSLMFPVIIIEPVVASLVELSKGGNIKIKIYSMNESKVIKMETETEEHVKLTYLLRVSTGVK